MQQLTQNLKDGKMELLEVPLPSLEKGKLLVKNYYSAVSAGTEGKSVRDARLGYIGKAKARPKEFKQVLNTAKKIGIFETYSLVMNKLTTPSHLGYSCAGKVLEVGEGVVNFKVGDYVACGGQGAVHSEIVSVYENLCVKVEDGMDLSAASFTTIGAIAIQGIRQSELKLGENCVIIGLGLLGQITAQVLKAAGVKTIGIDLDPNKVSLAKANGIDYAFQRTFEGLEEEVMFLTDGNGADAVIITAASNSNDPVNLAGAVSRHRAKVVCVGRVSTDFNRDTYYLKELDLRMSCSYGPGRYDVQYEEKGNDYPIGHVRWTENRNMKAFIQLLGNKKIDLSQIITHTFPFNDATRAYDLVAKNNEPFLGIVLSYDTKEKDEPKSIILKKITNHDSSQVNVGFIGAGSFAQQLLLPNLVGKAKLLNVATKNGKNAKHVASKFGFSQATSDGMEIINDSKINTIFIATRHNTHARFVLEALKKNKNVFIEKPLCLYENELEEIANEYSKRKVHLMVGFNRRFAPQIQKIVQIMGTESIKTVNYRINLGQIAPEHWTQDKEIGGGRIIGEVCHFIDISMFLCNSKPEMLSAFSIEDPLNLDNTLSIIIRFKNGSVANINYYANGNSKLSKEYLEVHGNGVSATLDDFHLLKIYQNNILKMKSKMNKGHKEEIAQFISAIEKGHPTPISFKDIYWTTRMTFDVINSIRERKTITY